VDSVKVLVQGYAQKDANGRWNATSTTTLVCSNGKNVLIDPGMNPEELKNALENEHLTLDGINVIVNSHSHLDHTRNSKLFDQAKVYNPFSLFKKIPENLVIPGTHIKVIHTPGHVDKHLAFLVETPEGQCAIAGDVIWWEDDEEQKTDLKSLLEHIDPAGKDQKVIQESRKKLFSMADYVIPGHGEVFRLPGK
jgi:glyoxylase-like metal-dependent hydrolase (beta-lactamase superfamily II)